MQWKVLAICRFLLALIVVTSHLEWFAPTSALTLISRFSGLAAVIGFLIISGYSIAHSVDRDTKQFYWRRFVRVMPIYVLAVLSSYILGQLPHYGSMLHATDFPAPTLQVAIYNLAFLQIFSGASLSNNSIVWTLAIEVIFYISAPWLVRLNTKFLLSLSLFSAIAFVFYERLQLPYFSTTKYGENIVLLGWPWLLGFWFYLQGTSGFARLVLVALPLLVCFFSKSEFFLRLWPLTILLTSLCIAYGGQLETLPVIVRKAFQIGGDISYPLYLFHIPAMLLLYDFVGVRSAVALVVIPIGFSYLIDRYCDRNIKAVLNCMKASHGFLKT